MLPTEIKVGHVFRYSYLWHWQHLEGREEGDKDRPCLVLASVTTLEDGTPVVRVLPITHTPPVRADEAIEIPPAIKRVDAKRLHYGPASVSHPPHRRSSVQISLEKVQEPLFAIAHNDR
ncbi:hypothetical protein [Sinorhizobium medicae]|uniref:hypothetical protein n=1 Tax=Sinorhizobium medicae TaxID=110321 RepID=UPI001296F45C|nr:hypothetical protein [Sinorhizobium medicae]MQV49268.1 hypothetical protein [Sinorhizobium medicae]MQV52718.1 hypothetical protein [Sinorhizobium medicae]MQV74645.1 hypothetical protein [Sinorhizobium medicae]